MAELKFLEFIFTMVWQRAGLNQSHVTLVKFKVHTSCTFTFWDIAIFMHYAFCYYLAMINFFEHFVINLYHMDGHFYMEERTVKQHHNRNHAIVSIYFDQITTYGNSGIRFKETADSLCLFSVVFPFILSSMEYLLISIFEFLKIYSNC